MEIIEMGGDSPVVARVSYDVYSPEYKREMVREKVKEGRLRSTDPEAEFLGL